MDNYTFDIRSRCKSVWRLLLLLPLLATQTMSLHAQSEVIEVLPLTDKVIMVHFDDGFARYHEVGEERFFSEFVVKSELNTASADNQNSWSISSLDDPAYTTAQAPIDVSRKSKGTEFIWECENFVSGVGCDRNATLDTDHVKEHWLYLTLPTAMQSGNTYQIDMGNLANNGQVFSLTFDDDRIHSEAIHINNMGYDPDANGKYAYVYHWMGTKGGVPLSAYNGNAFQLIDQSNGNVVFTGNLEFRKSATNQEHPYTTQTPNGNFLGAEVYECNFTGFRGTGTFVISVDGIGCSFPFDIQPDVYHEAFYWTMKGLYQNRSGVAITTPYTDEPRPAPHNPNITPGFAGQLVYSSFRYSDATNSDNSQDDKADWDNNVLGPINTWGWYQDAGDWDAYSTHSRVPANLMFLYEAAPGNFSDGELNIPESGNGIPDLLDEARWLIRFYHRTRNAIIDAGYGTGGVGGARVFGDLWGGDEAPDGSTQGSWQDVQRQWVVSGEDPHMTYTYAGLAAQFHWNLQQAGVSDPEGINWLQEAESAWTWAQNNTLPFDDTLKFANDLDLLASRMYAATALYRATGNATYHNSFIADVATKGWTTTSVLDKDNRYSAWIYSLMTNRTKDTATESLVRDAVIYTANFTMFFFVDERACRWANNYYFPMLVGQGTTPMVMEGVMAYNLVKDSAPGTASGYKIFLQTTCDYFLGSNPLSMTWLTGVGERSPKQVFHLDSWYSGNDVPRKGLILYGPWFDGNNLGPLGPWNHKWASATLTPSLSQWPGHERYYEHRSSPFTNEFTVHQNNGVAAVVYGFLKNQPGTVQTPKDIPAAPTSLTALVNPQDNVELQWNESTDNEIGFQVERKLGSGEFVLVTNTSSNVTDFVDAGLADGTYTYRVRSYNSIGFSAYTSEQTVVIGTGTPPPPPGGTYQAEDYTATDAALSTAHPGYEGTGFMDYGSYVEWNNVNEGAGTADLEFRYANGSGASRQCDLIVNGTTVGTLAFNASGGWDQWATETVTGVSLNAGDNTVRVQISTGFAGPNLDRMNVNSSNTGPTPPDAPTSLAATTQGSTAIGLSWTDVANDEDGYKVERKTGNGAFGEIASLSADASGYTDTGLSASTTYTYRVYAFNAAGNSGFSNESSATTDASNPPSGGGTYQAEDYTDAAASFSTANAGYEGTGFMDYGSYVEWNNVNEGAGTVDLEFRYANGSGGNRQCDLIVNGATVGTIAFSPSGSWTTWATTTVTGVSLNGGNNTVRVQVSNGFAGPNLDWMRVNGSNGTPPPPPGGNSTFFQDNGADGIVSMEAENYTSKDFGTGNLSGLEWTSSSDGAASNGAYMIVNSSGENANSTLTGPHMDYDIDFVKNGTHYLWMRFEAANASDDSAIPVIDGTSAGNWYTGTMSSWGWRRFTLGNINSGPHTISIYMREDGLEADKFVITTSAGYTPTGTGPAETANSGGARQANPDLGLNELSSQLFPNPSKGKVTLVYNRAERAQVQAFELVSGRMVHEGRYDSGSHLDLQLSPGVYLVKVEVGGQTNLLKLTIQK
ncbi:MAG: glycoside hydrolase family 9 protein [Bacteroidota bacterium]